MASPPPSSFSFLNDSQFFEERPEEDAVELTNTSNNGSQQQQQQHKLQPQQQLEQPRSSPPPSVNVSSPHAPMGSPVPGESPYVGALVSPGSAAAAPPASSRALAAPAPELAMPWPEAGVEGYVSPSPQPQQQPRQLSPQQQQQQQQQRQGPRWDADVGHAFVPSRDPHGEAAGETGSMYPAVFSVQQPLSPAPQQQQQHLAQPAPTPHQQPSSYPHAAQQHQQAANPYQQPPPSSVQHSAPSHHSPYAQDHNFAPAAAAAASVQAQQRSSISMPPPSPAHAQQQQQPPAQQRSVPTPSHAQQHQLQQQHVYGSHAPIPAPSAHHQQPPQRDLPVGLPLHQPPPSGMGEVVCPFCTVQLRYPLGADVVRCGACNSLSRIPPPQGIVPPVIPPPQPAVAPVSTRVQFPCAGCAMWLAADVKADGSVLARCPQCQTVMRPVIQQQQQQLQQAYGSQQPVVQQQHPALPQPQIVTPPTPSAAPAAIRSLPEEYLATLSPQVRREVLQRQQSQPLWMQEKHQRVLEQQQMLLAQAAKAKEARLAAQRSSAAAAVAAQAQAQGVAMLAAAPPPKPAPVSSASSSSVARSSPLPTQQVLSAGSSYIGLSGGVGVLHQARKHSVGDYSGMGSARAQQYAAAPAAPAAQFVPAPRPSPPLQESAASPEAAISHYSYLPADPAPIAPRPSPHSSSYVGFGSHLSQLHASASPPSAASSSSSAPAESKDDREAALSNDRRSDADFARDMALRLEQLHVDVGGGEEEERIVRAPVPKVKIAGAQDKALPLLANPM